MAKTTVLVANPEKDVLKLLIELSGEEFEIVSTENGAEAIELISELRPEVAVIDLALPCLDGLGLLEKAAGFTNIIAVSVFSNDEMAARCASLGAWYYIPKPCDGESLLHRVRAHLSRRRLKKVRCGLCPAACSVIFCYSVSSDSPASFPSLLTANAQSSWTAIR